MSQAVEIMREFLTKNNLLARKQLLEKAVADGRVVREMVDCVEVEGQKANAGASVGILSARRTQLILTESSDATGPLTRAEGQVETIMLTTPGEEPAKAPKKDLIETYAPFGYVVLTPEEVAALPGSDQFLSALTNLMVVRAEEANTPPPEQPVASPPEGVASEALPPVP